VGLQANYVSIPIWPRSISPLIPMVCHALPRMQWALVDAKRLECGSLLPLCLCAYAMLANARTDRSREAGFAPVILLGGVIVLSLCFFVSWFRGP